MHDSPIKAAMGAREWTLLIALSLLWGGAFLFIGIAVKELPPLTVVVLRVGLAALTLLVVMRALGLSMPREPGVWAAFFCMGMLNNVVPFTLIAWGQTHMASGVASIFNATTPLFTVMVAHFFTDDERITRGRLIGVVVGLTGVAVMMGGAAVRSLGLDVLAQLGLLGAAIFYAVSGVYGRRFKAMRIEPLATGAGMLTTSTIILMPIVLIVDRPWTLAMPSAAAIIAVLALSLLGTALAFMIYFRILATSGATNLMLVTFLIPVSAVVLGAIVLDERLEAKHFWGMALIGAGLAAIDGRPFTAARRMVSGSEAARSRSG